MGEKITTVLFDLDGTLLPMDNDAYTKAYFKVLAEKMVPYGYKPEELVNAVWTGTAAMVKNDGSQSNEDAFWACFASIYAGSELSDKDLFDEFYEKDFCRTKDMCGFNPLAAETVEKIKAAGLRVALATNPIFPAVATEQRIRWAGFDPSDFELCTTYENTSFCKPNPAYYLNVADRLGVSPEECLMVGNDVGEDMISETLGMRVFLLTDNLINRKDADIEVYPHGGFEELQKFIEGIV